MTTSEPSNRMVERTKGADTSGVALDLGTDPASSRAAWLTGRTADATLQDWVALEVIQPLLDRSEATWHMLVVSGIAPADLTAVIDVLDVPGDRVRWVADALVSMAQHSPALTLRDAVGWVMASAFQGGRPHPAIAAYSWPGADLAVSEPGWLFAAAGLSLDEVATLVGRGETPDRGTLLTMAALRGCPTPADGVRLS